jgi:hypothetical protein
VLEPVELGAGQHEVGALKGGGRIDCPIEHDRCAPGGVQLGGKAVGAVEALSVDVVEHQAGAAQPRRVDDVVDHRRPKRHATRPDHRDLEAVAPGAVRLRCRHLPILIRRRSAQH